MKSTATDAVEGTSPFSAFAAAVFGDGLSLLLRLWAKTLRLNKAALQSIDDMVANGDSLLVVFWHGQFFPLFFAAEGFDATVLVGSSWRGMVIARICRRFGYNTVFTQRNDSRLQALEDTIRSGGKIAALALDGPQGPHHVVKKGAVRIASDLGLRIVPLYVESHRAIVLGWRWDKREVPLLFSSLRLHVGQPLHIPSELGGQKAEACSAKLKHKMQALAAACHPSKF